MFPTIRSLAAPSALVTLVREAYDLPATTCTLVRSLTNDVYVVETDALDRYVLKVYGPGGWSLDDVRWEQQFARHLERSGIAVPTVMPLANGELAGQLDAAEGSRPFALVTYVAGTKPTEPFDDALYRDLGGLIARVHLAGLTFTCGSSRRPLDLRMLLDDPLDLVLPRLDHAPDDRRLVQELASAARTRITAAADELTWGVRHGDVSPDNTHRADGTLVLHDFDQSAPGWLVADLAGVSATEHWRAFLDGYRQVRPMPPQELDLLPWHGVVERIANLAFHLVDKAALHGTESIGDGWVDRELAALREAAATLR